MSRTKATPKVEEEVVDALELPEEEEQFELKVKRIHKDAVVPQYATPGAACFDLHAIEDGVIAGSLADYGQSRVFRTGLQFEVPEGWVMHIYSRSGMGFKSDVRLANCVGVIDSDYRGEVMVKLTADGRSDYVVHKGDRIAQAMLVPVYRQTIIEVDELSTTERGAGGLGSTGA